jgi:hypothetical protein
MQVSKGAPVLFQGEKYRVVQVTKRDVVIQDIEGNRLIVSPLTVKVGWSE